MGKPTELHTDFAPAERLAEEELKAQGKHVKDAPAVRSILDAMPEAVLILNQQRQIIFINTATMMKLGLKESDLLKGPRPGELLKCDNAHKSEGGCGTSKYCRQCGAVLAILASQQGNETENECRISIVETGDALDLKVKAAPFEYGGEEYTIFSILDISDEKRREVLQRIFFHDILNTAGGLSGYSELLQMTDKESEKEEYKEIIYGLSQKIISEIHAQRQLLAAENGELEPELTKVDSLAVLKNVADTYKEHGVTRDKSIVVDPRAENIAFKTDEALISRVLGNLVKNAVEASNKSGVVTTSAKRVDNGIEFSVHNQTVMPEEIQLQLFKRSFSTKGVGRGLGTYSVKLLTEKYLNGSVRFESNEEKGTTFYVRFPLGL